MLLDFETNDNSSSYNFDIPLAQLIRLTKNANINVDQSVIDQVDELEIPDYIIAHTRPETLDVVWDKIKLLIKTGGRGIFGYEAWLVRYEAICGYLYLIDDWPIGMVVPTPYLKTISKLFIEYFEDTKRVNIFGSGLQKYKSDDNKLVFSRKNSVPNCDIYVTDLSETLTINDTGHHFGTVIFETPYPYRTTSPCAIYSTYLEDKERLLMDIKELSSFVGPNTSFKSRCAVENFLRTREKGTLDTDSLDFFI